MLKALDTLTKIIERSIGLLEKLEAFGGQRKRKRLAQTLHLTYLRVNDCVTSGEQIIDVLQSFAKDPGGQFSFSGKHEIQSEGIYLEGLLKRQSARLDALADCLHDYSEIIRALDAASMLICSNSSPSKASAWTGSRSFWNGGDSLRFSRP